MVNTISPMEMSQIYIENEAEKGLSRVPKPLPVVDLAVLVDVAMAPSGVKSKHGGGVIGEEKPFSRDLEKVTYGTGLVVDTYR